MKLRLLVAVLAVAGFAQLSPRASAELLTLELGGNLGGTTNVTVNGKSFTNLNAGAFHWSDVNDPPNANFPPPIVTFCIEVEQGLPTTNPPTATFAALSPTAAPTIGNNPAKVDAIKALYGNFYDFANNKVVDLPGSSVAVENRAFQLALWEIVYDTGLQIGSGNFVSNASASTNTVAQSMLNGLSGGLSKFDASGLELVALVAPAGQGAKSQDQVQDHITVRPTNPIPAPPAVLLAGIGALALFGRARFTRRPTATA